MPWPGMPADPGVPVAAARDSGGAKLGGFANAVLRKVANDKEPPLPEATRERIAIEASLPAWILDELVAAVAHDVSSAANGGPDSGPGADASELVDRIVAERALGFAASAPLVARANRRRTTCAARRYHGIARCASPARS